MVWSLIVFASFALGLLRLPWWSLLIGPAVSLGLGAYAVAREPTYFDMHGFGYVFGAFAAVVCAVAWLLGRGLAIWLGPRQSYTN
jgi:hypothetical protein